MSDVQHCWVNLASICSLLQMFVTFLRNDTDPVIPQLQAVTGAIVLTQGRLCPADWKKNRGCWRFLAPSSSSMYSTYRAWASFWCRSDLSLQPAGLYLLKWFTCNFTFLEDFDPLHVFQHCPSSCRHAELHVLRRQDVFFLCEAEERGQS